MTSENVSAGRYV